MRNVFVAICAIVLFNNPLYAGSTVPHEKHPWRISYAEMMYMYWNDADIDQHFRLYVNESINNKPADIVTLVCNGKEIKALPGAWTTCEVWPHKPVSFIVTTKNFANGAEGVSERFY